MFTFVSDKNNFICFYKFNKIIEEKEKLFC